MTDQGACTQLDFNVSRHKVSGLAKRVSVLNGRYASIVSEDERLNKQFLALEHRLALKDDVSGALAFILQNVQNETVGKYNALLTELCRDVLQTDIQIKLIPDIERGRPSLNVVAIKDGKEEDIIDGKGGSVANIVSAGLRYIVLTRMTEHRQFIVLDEPDCWIKPSIAHRFASIINKMATDVGVQTLVVSHHSSAVFGDAHVVKMALDSTFNRVYIEDGCAIPSWSPEQKGIRKVVLRNFMTHEHTEVDLSPGNTVIVGDNDIGKSAFMRAIRAISYNEGKDNMIRHHCESCEVELHIEDNMVLKWTRKAKGSHKTAYFLFDGDGNQIRHEVDGTKVPTWVKDLLRIDHVQGLDVQIGHQLTPLFLLKETGPVRATLLSVGKDSQYIQAINKKYASRCAEDKREINRVKKELFRVQQIREYMESVLPDITMAQEDVSKLSGDISYKKEKLSGLDAMISSISKSNLTCDVIPLVKEPVVHDSLTLSTAMSGVIKFKGLELHDVSKIVSPEFRVVTPLAKALSFICLSDVIEVSGVEKPNMNETLGINHWMKKLGLIVGDPSCPMPSLNRVKDIVPPQMKQVTALSSLTLSLGEYSVDTVKSVIKPSVNDTVFLGKAVGSLVSSDIDELKLSVDGIQKEMDTIDKQSEDARLVDGKCILCGK